MPESSKSRRLTTIVALDVAGYSARTESDEERSVAEVVSLRASIEAIAGAHGGRLFNTAGDGFMLEFGSSLAATQAAFELARTSEPKVRVGVHLGDVAVQPNGDLLGHGVNVAARLMAQASPGSALISGAVYQTLRGSIVERLEPRGSLKLDKMSESIDTYTLHSAPIVEKSPSPPAQRARFPRRAVLVGGSAAITSGLVAGGLWLSTGSRQKDIAATGSLISIAVLPFANLSGDRNQDYFADGLSEELRASLAQIKALQVAARTSSNLFENAHEPITTIARKLGVKFLLDGSVRRSGNAIRVNAQLVEGATGFERWSQTYDRSVNDIFAVQSDIASLVAKELQVTMFGRPPATSPGGTNNFRAYEAFLRGQKLFDLSGDEATYREAVREYTIAIAADPAFAKAYARRAAALVAIGNQFASALAAPALVNAGLSDAEHALSLAPDLPIALSMLGFLRFNDFLDVRAAASLFERSMKLGSGDAPILGSYGLFSARIGRFDVAIPALVHLAKLDPLNAHTYKALGGGQYAARRYPDAIESFRRALILSPNMNSAHAAIGDCLLALGKLQDARAEYELEPQALTHFTGLAIVERRQGAAKAAETGLAELIASRGDNSLYQQAQVLAQWGKTDQALSTLERAYTVRDSGLVYLKNDPFLDSLRTNPRFVQLLKSIGFT